MSTKAYEIFTTRITPQSEPIPGEAQVQNHAGGFVYALGIWDAFQRFLVLGTEGGTYYVGERKLTIEAATNAQACLAADGRKFVDLIVAISDAGRAPKNDPAIFALALAAAAKTADGQGQSAADVRAYALAALPKVCRIPTHLFHFITYVKGLRGFGRGLRNAITQWYARWDANTLAFELVKYQSRDGWSNKDVLRVAHPRIYDAERQAVLRWTIGADLDAREVKPRKGSALRPRQYGAVGVGLPAILTAVEEAKTADTARLVQLIQEHRLTREMVPSEALTKPEVWEALLAKMPLTALLRNLGNMSKVGLLTPLSEASKTVVARLAEADAYKKARVHPVAVLVALKTYGQGHGLKGKGEWLAVPAVVDALDDGFYLAFGAIEPVGKRLLYALDVSGSMSSPIGGLPISCAEGAAAMALACAKTERAYLTMGFADGFRNLGLTPKMRLDDVLKRTEHQNFGGTDCSLPMTWALSNKMPVDAFIVITDSETWSGRMHPKQALKLYRDGMGIPAAEVVMGMTATEFSIADPQDPLTLDVVGFDTNTPSAISEFLR